jgi:hypothetical protein
MFERQVHQLDQKSFMSKVVKGSTLSPGQVDVTLLDTLIKDAQQRVKKLKIELELKEEEIDEILEDILLKILFKD